MGFIFCSLARSLEASCHSFDMVLGGGGARKEVGQLTTISPGNEIRTH